MPRVSLVGTRHQEKGRANVPELVAILERINPDVIFLEIPPTVFDSYLNDTRRDLESTAVRRYQELHPIELVPVDLPPPDEDFFRNNRYLFQRVERRSPEYCRLVDCHTQNLTEHGFAYLNGERCSKHWSDLDKAIRATLAEIGDQELVELYELWKDTNGRRDRGMMKNIQDYCRQNFFGDGAFLVGSAHRQSFIELSMEQHGGICWDFSGFLNGNVEK